MKLPDPSRLRPRLAAAGTRVEAALGLPWVGAVLVVALGLLYLHAYGQHPLNPGSAPATARLGWWSWADQFVYWQSAAELAQFRLTAENYHYPLGYSFLGALFWRLMPAHPFLIPDLLLVLGSAVGWWRLTRGWLNRRLTLLTAVVFILGHREVLALTQIVPWNTIATQCLLIAGLGVMVASAGRRAVVGLTGLAALTYLVRPGDAACFAPMLVWSVLRLSGWRERLICGAAGVAAIAAVVVAVALVNHAVFGTRDTPYERMTWEAIGFFSYPVLPKLYWLFVDGGSFFGETDTALLFRYPWLFLVVPGAVYWVRRQGMAAAAALATVALNWVLYANYNDFLPSAIFRYSLVHYLTWAFAPLFAVAVAGLWQGWRDRSVQAGLGVALGLAVLATGLQLEQRELPVPTAPGRVETLPDVRPLWVSFPGESLTKVRQLRLDGRHLQEAGDYQIPYVPADLRVMLSARARGETLTALPEADLRAVPTVGDFVWGWRFDLSRWRRSAPRGD